MRIKRLSLGSLLFVFVTAQLAIAYSVLRPSVAAAVPVGDVTINLRFTSSARIVATIGYDGRDTQIIFRDGNPMDTTMRYEASGDNHCPGSLTILESEAMRSDDDYDKEPRIITATTQSSNPRATTDIDFRPDSNSTCQEIGGSGDDVEAEITDKANGRAFYAYTAPNQISRVWDSGNHVFTQSTSDPTVFTRDVDANESECRDFMKILTGGSSYQLYDIRAGGGGAGTPGPEMPAGCRYNTDNVTGSDSYNFGASRYVEEDRHAFALSARSLVGLQNIDDDPTNDSGPPASVVDEGDNEDDSCESKSGAMGWILCPVINLIDGAMNFVDTQVTRLIKVDENKYTDEGVEEAWKVVRNLAYIILVPIVLVMVISTALGFEFISAYTVKRALPRLVAATIFIALSWQIVTFAVALSNNVGSGVLGIMEAPFSRRFGPECQSDLNLACFFEVESGDRADNILHGVLAVPEAAASIVGLVIFIILFGATMLTAIVIGFLVLLARQMFIIALMVVAPLAILAWIFPGNDKLWRSWWSLFSKLLIMFPLIMALIGVGRIFAAILKETDASGPEGAILNPIMKLAAYMLPYALIPLTFKFAGGAFATLAGFADNKSKGIFDRQREKRAARVGRMQENRFLNERKYDPSTLRGRLVRRANTAASIATSNPWDTARIYAGTSGGKSILSHISAAKYQQTLGLQEALGKQGISNDRALAALAGRNTKIGSVRTARDLQRAIGVLQEGDAQDRIGATQLQNAYSFLSDLHTNPDYGRGSLEGAALMNWSAQGFANAADIAAVSNSIGGGVGASIANQATFLGYKAGGRPDLKPSYGVQADADGRFFDALTTEGKTGDELENAITSQAKLVTGLKVQDLMGAKSGAIKSMKEGMKRLMDEGVRADAMAELDIRNGMPADQARATAEEAKGRAKAIRQTILQASSRFSQTDPESKRQWQALAGEIGITPQELQEFDSSTPQAKRQTTGDVGGASGGDDE